MKNPTTAWRWYISIEAVRQWMELTGRSGPLEDSNPHFAASQNELGVFSLTARLAKENDRGALLYRTGTERVGNRRVRVELTVVPFMREEGKLPQLVRVTVKPK